MANTSEKLRTAGIVILASLALVAALYFGSDFLVPIALAVALDILFRPVVRMLKKIRLPAALSSALIVLWLAALLVAAGMALSGPIRGWVGEVPQRIEAAQARLQRFRDSLHRLNVAATRLEHDLQPAATAPTSQPSATPAPAPAPSPIPGGLPAAAIRIAGTTTKIVGGAAEVLVLLYLLLASGGVFVQKLACILHRPEDKSLPREVVQEAEAVVFRYVTVAAMINAGEALVVTLVLWWLGMPTPLLWGLFTFVLEFIPYLGAATMIVLLGLTALATYDTIGHILLPPGAYLLITTLQSSLVSPLAYGRRLNLSPVAILIGVLFWWSIWGIAGAFLAVPILATLKVVVDRTESLRPVGELLGE